MAVAAPSRVCDSGARELQPLIERRILFHPAKDATLASGISALPPGIEPLNRGFDAAPAPASAPPAPAPATENADAGAASPHGTKRSWQEANTGAQLDQAPLRIGAGLSNLGNTCFLNSVLQCLTYTLPLANFLQTGQHKASCRHSGFCALCALETHVKEALRSRGKVVSPNFIVKNLRSISRAFQPWRQEDAHEYLRYLMEALQRSCLPNKTPSNSPEQEKTIMHNLFCGRLRSEVKCTVCLQRSETMEPFWDLSLDITRADSLGKALARFTANEFLDGENKYNCSKCKKKVRAIKRFTVESAPSILTVQFKRFSSTGMHGQKIDKKVHFGRTLDLTPFMSNARDGAVYDLYAVLVHSGHSTHSGHYYCFVKTSGDMWHVLDDSRVKQLSEQNVLDQKAYILFYARKQMKSRPTPGPSTVAAAKPADAKDSAPVPSSIIPAAKMIASETPSEAGPSKAPEVAKVPEETEKIPVPEPPVSLPEKPTAAEAITTPADAPASTTPEVSSTPVVAIPAPAIPEETKPSGESAPVDAPEPEPMVIEDTPVVTTSAPVKSSAILVEMLPDTSSSLPAAETSAEPVIIIPSTEAATSEPAATAATSTTSSIQEVEQKEPENRFPEVSKHSRSSGKKPKPESPRKFLFPRKTESPRKGYLKLLRAMPKSRRFFMERALELDQSERIESGSSSKRRRLMDNAEFKTKQASPPSENESPKQAAPEATSKSPAAPLKQVSEASLKPGSSSSELFGSGVARWDDVDAKDIDRLLKSEHKLPAKKLDEWDEEYDRGKVKKLRRVAVGGRLTPCKNNEAGQNSNPFQVLAGNKHKK